MTVGNALMDALKAEGMSETGGQIIVSTKCYDEVKEYFAFTQLPQKPSKSDFFYTVDVSH